MLLGTHTTPQCNREARGLLADRALRYKPAVVGSVSHVSRLTAHRTEPTLDKACEASFGSGGTWKGGYDSRSHQQGRKKRQMGKQVNAAIRKQLRLRPSDKLQPCLGHESVGKGS